MRRGPLFVVLVLLCWPSVAQADQADALFQPDRVAAVDITLPASSKEALDEDSTTYQPATLSVTVGGTTYGPLNTTLKLKGNSTFRTLDKKAAFKIKLEKGKPLLGLKKLTLNNMIMDPTMLHETQAYRTFRAVGVPAPRTGYAFVRVNGQPYGVYLNLETYDDVSLKRMFPSTKHLYESGYQTDLADGDWQWYEIDEGDEDRSDLQDLEETVGKPGDFSDRMAGKADLAEMVKMWAVEKYIGHWDGYAGRDLEWTPNNYYLHSTTAGLFSMLPWGTDQTWEQRPSFEQGGVLYKKCRADSSCDASFRQALAQVTRTVNGMGLQAEVRRLAGMLEPYQRNDPRMENDMYQVARWQDKAVQFMDRRPSDMATYLGDPTLVPAPDPDPDPDPPATPAQPSQGADPAPSVQPSTVPPAPIVGSAAPAPPMPARVLRVGASRRSGAVISTPVRLPQAGSASQRMTAGGATVCLVRARRLSAGRHVLRCRLTPSARRRLRRGSLRISQTTRLAGLAPVRAQAVLTRCSGC